MQITGMLWGRKLLDLVEFTHSEVHGPELSVDAVSYTHLRAHETLRYLVCRLLLEKKMQTIVLRGFFLPLFSLLIPHLLSNRILLTKA